MRFLKCTSKKEPEPPKKECEVKPPCPPPKCPPPPKYTDCKPKCDPYKGYDLA